MAGPLLLEWLPPQRGAVNKARIAPNADPRWRRALRSRSGRPDRTAPNPGCRDRALPEAFRRTAAERPVPIGMWRRMRYVLGIAPHPEPEPTGVAVRPCRKH